MVHERRADFGLRTFAVVLAVATAVGCTRTVELTHVSALPRSSAQRAFAHARGFRTALPQAVAAIQVAAVRDERGDVDIGAGRDELMRVGYGVEAADEVGPWVHSYVHSALVAEGMSPVDGAAAPAAAPRGVLTVTLRRFHIDEATWARGVAVLDVRLVWSDGRVEADRLTAVTNELWSDDGSADWALGAARLAAWSAHRVAGWTAAAASKRRVSVPPSW
jgi:hypothetical protein